MVGWFILKVYIWWSKSSFYTCQSLYSSSLNGIHGLCVLLIKIFLAPNEAYSLKKSLLSFHLCIFGITESPYKWTDRYNKLTYIDVMSMKKWFTLYSKSPAIKKNRNTRKLSIMCRVIKCVDGKIASEGIFSRIVLLGKWMPASDLQSGTHISLDFSLETNWSFAPYKRNKHFVPFNRLLDINLQQTAINTRTIVANDKTH